MCLTSCPDPQLSICITWSGPNKHHWALSGPWFTCFFATKVEIDIHHQMFIIVTNIITCYLSLFCTPCWHFQHILGPGLLMLKSKFLTQIALRSNNAIWHLRIFVILQFGGHIFCCVSSTCWEGTFGIFNETNLHNMGNCVHIIRKSFAQSWLEKRMLTPLLTNISYSSQSVTFVKISPRTNVRIYSYQKFDTNECPNKYSYWKSFEYSNICLVFTL